jgi:aspartate racemase
VAAISAVTPHVCIGELTSLSPLPIVSAVQAVATEIESSGYRRVALFGTRFVVESRMFGMLETAEVIGVDRAAEIHEAYMQVVENGRQGIEMLNRIARELSIDAVVIAGTDLSPVYDQNVSGVPCIDAAAVHVRAIMRRLNS